MNAVYRKELKSLFSNMTAPVFIAWVLVWISYFTKLAHLEAGSASFEAVCVGSPFLAFLMIPVLTMRSFAEERHSRTDQLLYTLPISNAAIIFGKYFSMVTVLAIPMGIAALYPLVLSFYGDVNLLTAYTALLAMFFLGCTLIAICMFISSLTESQIIAAVMSFGAVVLTYFTTSLAATFSVTASTNFIATIVMALLFGVLAYLLSKNLYLGLGLGTAGTVVTVLFYAMDPSKYEGFVTRMLLKIALFNRMNNFGYGLLDLTTYVYFLSLCGLFLFFTAQSLEKKRWS